MKSTIRTFTIAALLVALAACSGMGPMGMMKTPDVPAAIVVPSGNKLAFALKGSGLQNYECRAKADAAGGYDWALVSPEAALRDRNDALVGKHYGGPTWEHGDGSKVSGKTLAAAPAPTPGNIPWLLLQGSPSPGNGAFSGVTYVQRINTNAGTAPSDPCNASTAGSKKQVRYSADYAFYKS
ncbi:MAG: DUF3455 domain-containing protein [Burkholderiaceae bacterium]